MKLYTNVAKITDIMSGMGLRNGICAEIGEMIVFSGLTALDLDTGELLEDGPIEDHANLALDCYAHILGELGLTLDNVVKVSCFLEDPTDFQRWNEVFKARFSEPCPLRTTVASPLVVGKIELEIVATRTTRAEAEVKD